ncbi:MAG: hypothetical protein A2W99_09770 [Bacteroidetes bacterium GWF2_33_16]|nr:MAG: hypothetical protein A2X00_06680 [Bacteroidetes bacterium GWE2_32_14]OFY07280.1 MAG: hypothetical protein A2W99_09770 [Bacteroidetes bacterium GWF2_33_16]
MLKCMLLVTILFLIKTIGLGQNAAIDSLEELLKENTAFDTVRINLLNKTALKYSNINVLKTLQYGNEADSISKRLGYKYGEAESQRMIGVYYRIKSDYNQALINFNYSIKLDLETGNKKGIANANNNIGSIYYSQGDYSKAHEYFNKSFEIANELGDKTLISNYYNNIGIIYRHQGNYPKALESYQNSLRIDEETGNKTGLANSYNNIAIIYRHQGDFSKALEYYQKSLQIKEETDDKRGMSISYSNLGVTYYYKGDNSKALEYLGKSLEIREETGDKRGMASCYNTIGEVNSVMGNYSQALNFYTKGLGLSIETGSKSLEVTIYSGLGALYLKQNKISEAFRYCKKAYELAQSINDIGLLKSSSEMLHKCYAAMGQYKEAYFYLGVFKSLSDSIINEENTKKIVGLEYEYKYEKEKELAALEQEKKDAIYQEDLKRQKSIRNSFILGFVFLFVLLAFVLYSFIQKRKTNLLLAAKKLEIENKNEELTILNSDKDRFMQILAHDLLGPLSSSLGLSEALLEDFQTQESETIEQVIKTIHRSQQNIINLLNDLLLWSKMQAGKIPFKPENLDFKEICNDILKEKQSQADQKNITILSYVDESTCVFADINMLKTILRNLISNAIKFTNRNGKVEIFYEKNDQYTIITISDSGIGISDEDKYKLWNFANPHTTPGTNKERGTGLGLILCKEFVEKHGGKIWVESEPGNGSKFKFSIPL